MRESEEVLERCTLTVSLEVEADDNSATGPDDFEGQSDRLIHTHSAQASGEHAICATPEVVIASISLSLAVSSDYWDARLHTII